MGATGHTRELHSTDDETEDSMESSSPFSRLIPRPAPRLRLVTRSHLEDSDKEKSEESENEPKKDSTEKTVKEGSLCEVKILYEGPEKCKCCINWVEKNPEDSRQAEEKSKMKRYAFIIRMRKNHDDGKSLVLDSSVVHSSHLKKLLAKVFKGCSGITPTLKKLTLKAPFWSLYYRWDIFTEVVQHQLHPDAAAQAELFYTTLESELKPTISEIKDLLKHGVMTFQTLWALFEPETVVYHRADDYDRFFRVHSCDYQKTNCGQLLVVRAQYVDWDGKRFGFAMDELPIPEFSGTKPIIQLPVFPAKYHPSVKSVTEALLKRGKHFENISGFNYTAYSGMVKWIDRSGPERKIMQRHVDGRIVIDARSHALFNPREKIRVSPIDIESHFKVSNVSDGLRDRSQSEKYITLFPPEHHEMYNKLLKPLTDEANGNFLSGTLLLLCTPHVRGYSLQIKRWVVFDVDNVCPIIWNDAFQNLVLSEDYKKMILAFVESQIANKGDFDDVVRGKGQGMIMMLAGSPGIGKTLTAEAVADKLRRPLYMLGSGELGVSADDVEHNLRTVLDLTARWDAVLLIDESDVFLEKRSTQDLARNKVVAVFLRLLEYYSGIMFMTTNRADTIDPAFSSRIHLTIQYPPLNKNAKKRIWANLVNSSDSKHTLSKADFHYLASLDMNGRQIKNSVKTAQLLASNEKKPLRRDHFQQVLKITQGISDSRLRSKCHWVSHWLREVRTMSLTRKMTVRMATRPEDKEKGKGKEKSKGKEKGKGKEKKEDVLLKEQSTESDQSPSSLMLRES